MTRPTFDVTVAVGITIFLLFWQRPSLIDNNVMWCVVVENRRVISNTACRRLATFHGRFAYCDSIRFFVGGAFFKFNLFS